MVELVPNSMSNGLYFDGGPKITMNHNRSLNFFYTNANTDTKIDTALRAFYVLDRPGYFPDWTAFQLLRDWNYTPGVRWYFHPEALFTLTT